MSATPLPCDQPGNPSPCRLCGATYGNLGCPEKALRYDRIAACHDELVAALEDVLAQINHPGGIELADLYAAAARGTEVLAKVRGEPA